MTITFHNPASLPATSGGYAHAVEVKPNARMLFISGQIPGAEHTTDLPPTFEAQCEAVWQSISTILAAANMTVNDLVKVTTYLTHADQVNMNGEIRRRFLGDHTPALTVLIVGLLQSGWMLEIEAIAAAE